MTMAEAMQEPYSLGAAERQLFHEQGFIKLKDAVPADVITAIEPEITRKLIDLNTMHLPLAERSTYDKAFLQVGNLWRHSESVQSFVFNRRLARIAADLLGVSGVRLYADQALYKESGGGITPWHADQYYWPLSSDKICTVWIPLQETPVEMGSLSFAAGSHTFSYGRDLAISDESESAIQAAVKAQGFPVAQAPYALGEVSFHTGWIFHRASPNQTSTPRRVMTMIYMDKDMRVATPNGNHQEQELAIQMPGASPGEIPDTPLNPVLYVSQQD
jgi:ectoine hydroxylase-related dioxygenase (phytanoyl-CoA dioxygenase family)